MLRPLVLLGLAVLISGCAAASASPTATARPNLGISNGTTLAVTVGVNGRVIGIAAPGGPSPTFDAVALPDLPWTVEARSPSGRVLTSMTVEPGDVASTTPASGVTASSGTLARVDLSCGSLRIWAGFPPSGPAPASPMGSPGDCAP